jgi:hypothetical protein
MATEQSNVSRMLWLFDQWNTNSAVGANGMF